MQPRHVAAVLEREQREDQLSEAIGLLEMRIARHDEGVDADILILLDAGRDGLGIADERRAGAAAHEADAGPQVRSDLQLVALAAMELRHALLADRVHPRKILLRARYGLVADMLDQLARGLPGRFIGLADNHMKPDAEGKLATARAGDLSHHRDL